MILRVPCGPASLSSGNPRWKPPVETPQSANSYQVGASNFRGGNPPWGGFTKGLPLVHIHKFSN